MKVFFAGATGVVGKRAVAGFVAAGHDVTAVARNRAKADYLRLVGAQPVSVDLFDAAAVNAAVAGHDVVVNMATHIPPLSKAAMPGAWKENDRIRTEVSRNLADAVIAHGVGRYIQESITFHYEVDGDAPIDEDRPLRIAAYAKSTLDAEAQAQRVTEAGGVGIVLRFGMFYGPDSNQTVTQVRMLRRRYQPDGRSARQRDVVDPPRRHRQRGRCRARRAGRFLQRRRRRAHDASRLRQRGRGRLRHQAPSSPADVPPQGSRLEGRAVAAIATGQQRPLQEGDELDAVASERS